jgi:hypothetical protein
MLKQTAVFLSLAVVLSACNFSGATQVPSTITPSPVMDELTLTPSGTPPPAPTDTATSSKTPIPTVALSKTPTDTLTPTITSPPTILRGEVLPEKLSCRYGPGAMYLYLYGLNQTARQDVIGRTDTGKWVLTRSHGDNIMCWVKTEFLQLNGDVLSLDVVYPDKYKLPVSPYYNPPFDVHAVRDGNNVTITWKSQPLRAGDEEGPNMQIYIVEVWACKDGQVTFTPYGTSYATLTVADEPGCSEPSYGRVFFQEKHGFAGPSEIPWPPAR